MPNPRIKYEITAEDKAKRSVEKIEQRLKRAAKFGAGALAAGATAATAAIVTLSTRAAQAADNVGKLSLQLGIGVKALSEYQFIAAQTGVKFETFSQALQRSTRRVAEAAQGTGEARDAIRELGLDAQRLNELDPSAQFELLAQRLNQVTNESDQVRLAFKLFDSEGVRLLRTVKQTGGEFDTLRERARSLGAVVDESLTQQAADVNDSMSEVSTALSGVGNTLLANFGPAIVSAANTLTELINNARKAAASIGLITLRVAELSNTEINAEIEANNARIKALRIQAERTRSITGRKAANREILEIEQRNLDLQSQLVKIEQQRTETAKTRAAQGSAVVAAVGAVTPEAQSSEDKLQKYLESLYTEEEALRASYARRIQIIDENTKAGSDLNVLLKQKEHERLEQAVLEHQARLGSIEAKGIIARRKFEELNARQRTKTVIGEIATLTAGVAQHNKTLFKINKVASIAQAILNAHEGISLTLAKYPYPLNVGLAALHGAAAFAQVSAIRNTSFSGGGAGTTPSLAGTAGTINDVPVDTAPVVDEGLTARREPNVINISFNPGITDTEAVRQFVTEDLSEALRDGAGIDVRVVAQ